MAEKINSFTDWDSCFSYNFVARVKTLFFDLVDYKSAHYFALLVEEWAQLHLPS